MVGMHTIAHKRKLLARVRRVRGQVEAVERALLEERGCATVVRTIAAARGGMNALASEVLADHLADHVLAPRLRPDERLAAGNEVSDVIRQFLR
jgi:FrmR/RcnR family transcriptional regulator, repressor of rcnA expression